VLAGDPRLSPLQLQAQRAIAEQRRAGRIDMPSPLFEDARFRKFMREVFETVAYGKIGEHEAARGCAPTAPRCSPASANASREKPTWPSTPIRPLQFQVSLDPDTGARVTRLTPPDVTCHRNYFYQKCFTNDGTRLLFGGEFGPGTDWNYHLLDLQERRGTATDRSTGENTFGGFLSPDDRFLYFVRAERQLIRLDLATLQEDVAYTVPDGWVGYGTWVANSACTKMVGIEIRASDWFPLTDWQKFARCSTASRAAG
jgi:hypothetical protein